ncbi:MAG: DUF3841 domain-containing protein [Candidatus Eremiobacteraeota bacterium]|nr:DUF3841 domain-containing protein [Candidatus Eremiobacteraeota bacterium]
MSRSGVRYWTVQPISVWETLQKDGLCRVDPAKVFHIPDCYKWLVEQLKRRLPNYEGNYPWWLYCGKPDLRWVRWTRPQGTWEVRLEVELPAERVQEFLIRDWDVVYCQAWLFKHLPRNRWYDFQERRGWEDLAVYPEPYESLLKRTWQRLFDSKRALGLSRYRSEAVVETLYLEDVIQARPFKGTSTYRKAPTPENAEPELQTS